MGGIEGPRWAPHHTEGAGDVLITDKPSPRSPVPPGQGPGETFCHNQRQILLFLGADETNHRCIVLAYNMS